MLQLLYAKIQEIVLLPTAISEKNSICKCLYNIYNFEIEDNIKVLLLWRHYYSQIVIFRLS